MLNIIWGNIAEHSQYYYIYMWHMSINMIYITTYPQHDSLSISVSSCKVGDKSQSSGLHERASQTYTFKLCQNEISISDLKKENYIQFNKRKYICVSNVMLYIDCLTMREDKRDKPNHTTINSLLHPPKTSLHYHQTKSHHH